MAAPTPLLLTCLLIISFLLLHSSHAARTPAAMAVPLSYHKGPLLTGTISINLIWYGHFTPSHRSIVSDFIASLSSPTTTVSAWWSTVEKLYYHHRRRPALTLGNQILDDAYSLGKSLTDADLLHLAARGRSSYAINVVLTAADVAVEGFCMSRCGTHGSRPGHGARFAYVWVGNSVAQCPGQCAWPFHQPMYGPQAPPLVAPNGDVGADGMVVNLAGLVAGVATNPFGDGYYQGVKEAPLEAATACAGVYAKGAYPGYAGDLLVDGATGASYNANGIHGRKYLLPAIFDPWTSSCSTLV